MPEALAALALAKMSPAAAAIAGDHVQHLMGQEFHVFPEQRQALFDQAKETIIEARSALLAPDASSGAASTAPASLEAQPEVTGPGVPVEASMAPASPEVVQQGVPGLVMAAWAALFEFTNTYCNCGNDKHFRSSSSEA